MCDHVTNCVPYLLGDGPEHRPLGNVSRARKRMYQQLALFAWYAAPEQDAGAAA